MLDYRHYGVPEVLEYTGVPDQSFSQNSAPVRVRRPRQSGGPSRPAPVPTVLESEAVKFRLF
jgi:hypothetical protein